MTPRGTCAFTLLAALLLALPVPTAAQRAPAVSQLHLPAEVLSLACAPRLAPSVPDRTLSVVGGQDSFIRRIHAPGDLITLNAGTEQGLEVGQEFYVRRMAAAGVDGRVQGVPNLMHTVGWIRVYAVDPTMSLATVTHACDTIEIGDHLAPFALPEVPPASTDAGKPTAGDYGRILTGANNRQVYGDGDYIIVDRGSAHGVAPGSRFVIYHDKNQPENFLYELGEAVALEVSESSALLQVMVARDVLSAGDLVGLRRPE
ncbi:MAG: hypothetical protein AB7G23_05300 [Vicinamibacterales bacterium]